MITCSRLGRLGQLGNQCFQTALLIGVAAKNGYQVGIPQGGHVKKKDKVELWDCFDLQLPRIWRDNLIKCKRHPFLYEPLKFNPLVFEQPDYTDFAGYYQTEKYFKHAEAEVRKRFKFTRPIMSWVSPVMGDLARDVDRLVAIHVRRGDYLEHPNNFTIVTPDYIERAMNHPAFSNDRNRFLVFSDDLGWCHDNIRGDVELVRSPSHLHDLAMMSMCDSHIISASSFGWWGAWLSQAVEQTVIAPDPWFPAAANIDTSDVCPEHWIKMEV